MALTYVNIATTTLGSSQSTITFSSISSAYTDLVVQFSARTNRSGWPYDSISMRLNNITTINNYAYSALVSSGTSVSSNSSAGTSDIVFIGATATTAASNTFGFAEIYIPRYSSAIRRQIPIISVAENNSSSNYVSAMSSLLVPTPAIDRIDLYPTFGASFIAGSTFYLYGIKN